MANPFNFFIDPAFNDSLPFTEPNTQVDENFDMRLSEYVADALAEYEAGNHVLNLGFDAFDDLGAGGIFNLTENLKDHVDTDEVVYSFDALDASLRVDVGEQDKTRARAVRSRNKIPRPPNAFILYRKHHHSIVKEAHGRIHNNEISKIIGAQWAAESSEVKKVWQDQAKKAKEEHAAKYPDYAYMPRRPSERRRRTRSRDSTSIFAARLGLELPGITSELSGFSSTEVTPNDDNEPFNPDWVIGVPGSPASFGSLGDSDSFDSPRPDNCDIVSPPTSICWDTTFMDDKNLPSPNVQMGAAQYGAFNVDFIDVGPQGTYELSQIQEIDCSDNIKSPTFVMSATPYSFEYFQRMENFASGPVESAIGNSLDRIVLMDEISMGGSMAYYATEGFAGEGLWNAAATESHLEGLVRQAKYEVSINSSD